MPENLIARLQTQTAGLRENMRTKREQLMGGFGMSGNPGLAGGLVEKIRTGVSERKLLQMRPGLLAKGQAIPTQLAGPVAPIDRRVTEIAGVVRNHDIAGI